MMKKLLGLLVIVLTLGVFSSCTTDSVEEIESLQILEDQNSTSGSSRGSSRPQTANSNG